jgi:hypothetical protein
MSSPSAAGFARPCLLIATVSLAIAACSSAAAPTQPASASSSAPAATTPSTTPSQPATTDPSAGPDDPVTGPSDPGAGGLPGSGIGDGGKLVIPHPGTANPHPVAVESIVTNVDGRHLTAKLSWTSGVEPCYVLDSVVVSKDGTTIDLTVVEGSTDPTAMCIEIAQTKSTIVDLGELEPGTWTIAATNSRIPPVTVTVS